jgi:hypothetical protein
MLLTTTANRFPPNNTSPRREVVQRGQRLDELRVDDGAKPSACRNDRQQRVAQKVLNFAQQLGRRVRPFAVTGRISPPPSLITRDPEHAMLSGVAHARASRSP